MDKGLKKTVDISGLTYSIDGSIKRIVGSIELYKQLPFTDNDEMEPHEIRARYLFFNSALKSYVLKENIKTNCFYNNPAWEANVEIKYLHEIKEEILQELDKYPEKNVFYFLPEQKDNIISLPEIKDDIYDFGCMQIHTESDFIMRYLTCFVMPFTMQCVSKETFFQSLNLGFTMNKDDIER